MQVLTAMKTYTVLALVFAVLTSSTLFAAAPLPDREVYVMNAKFEGDIGYSRAVRVGRTIYISGHTAKGEGMEQQVQKTYESLGRTLAHFGADFSCVVKENIYTKDLEALKAANPVRKKFYGETFPAATWVQVDRLFVTELLLEVELVAVLPEPVAITK
jgi:enamine deaminase RidA (YjgF/YER057c/UK114 family)